MLLESLELFLVGIPLRQPLAVPSGTVERLETVVVALHSGEATGWGEASPGNGPWRSSEWAGGVFHAIRDFLGPAIASQSFSAGEDLQKALEFVRGNQFAKAALDIAWWDLNSRLQNQPLHRMLDARREAVEVGPTLDRMESIDGLADALGQALEAGFPRVKLKFRPGWDVNMVDFVRKEFPTLAIHIDCEAGLHLGFTDMLYRLEDFTLTMIEQPLPAEDLVGHAMLQESLRTPLCLDESIVAQSHADMALELHSCKYVNLKPGRVGGLTPAVAIHDLCHQACVPCFVGAMPQSTIAGRAGLALAAKENCSYPSDFFPSQQVLADDLAEPLLPTKDPADGVQKTRLWSGPGLGVEPDREKLEKWCIAKHRLGQ